MIKWDATALHSHMDFVWLRLGSTWVTMIQQNLGAPTQKSRVLLCHYAVNVTSWDFKLNWVKLSKLLKPEGHSRSHGIWRQTASWLSIINSWLKERGKRKEKQGVILGYQLDFIPAKATSHGPCVYYARDLCRKSTKRCIRLADTNCD
jgi:hypothetical protein